MNTTTIKTGSQRLPSSALLCARVPSERKTMLAMNLAAQFDSCRDGATFQRLYNRYQACDLTCDELDRALYNASRRVTR